MLSKLRIAGSYLGQTARLMVGVPSYDTYLQHMRQNHPDKTAMTYEEFFLDRQRARYEGGIGRCC
ncbi:MAG: YbdD/YjiX family protein [Pseudomonadota bacterium]|nr:YbdD/YjiX family protein [Pseudomonadota bacterium]